MAQFFKVLGRIDEEASSRFSMSNMISQDSSPRSSNSSDESEEVTDWPTPLSLERFGNIHYNEKDTLPTYSKSSSNNSDNGSSSNHNVTIVTTITDVKDTNMDQAASVERRQDRSSPSPLESQTPSLPPHRSLSLANSSSFGPKRQPQRQQEQTQRQKKDQQLYSQNDQDEEKIKRENQALQRECEELESIFLLMKSEGDILQVRTALKLKNYQMEIELATESKQRLQNQCKELEHKVWSLRNETRLRQESIWAADIKLRLQASAATPKPWQ